jgi:3-deoxy-manno-octulosonate cytidylyltransferase (CMP-KDO synthetase)
MRALISIPARFAATRLPGKPLVLLAGKTLVERVVDIANSAKSLTTIDTDVIVAADDEKVSKHCESLGIPVVMTPVECRTGTDRSREVLLAVKENYDIVASVQVDAPLTPPHVVAAMINALVDRPESSLATPVVQLTWKELDFLREAKKSNPFSGCTVIVNREGKALWFSKNIIPALRDEQKLRSVEGLSPILQHVGIYCYRSDLLIQYAKLPSGYYENLESLEQLRVLENGLNIEAVRVDYRGWVRMSGIDAPADLERAERHIQERGEVLDYFSI